MKNFVSSNLSCTKHWALIHSSDRLAILKLHQKNNLFTSLKIWEYSRRKLVPIWMTSKNLPQKSYSAWNYLYSQMVNGSKPFTSITGMSENLQFLFYFLKICSLVGRIYYLKRFKFKTQRNSIKLHKTSFKYK